MTPSRGSTPELPPVVSSMRMPIVLSLSVQQSSSVAMQWIKSLAVPRQSACWSSSDFSQILKANAALTNQLGVHMHDDVIVFRVDDAKPSFLRKNLECLPDITKIDHTAAARRQDIGGEYLQRRVTRLDRLRELTTKFRRRLRMQHDVIRPIAGAFSYEILVTILDGLECRSAVAPIGEIDECSCTAVKRCAADLLRAGGDKLC